MKSHHNIYSNVLGWILSANNEKYSVPIKKAYFLSLIFTFFPILGRQKKNNPWIVGSKIFFSDSRFQQCTLISTPKDLVRVKHIPYNFQQFYRLYSLIFISLITKKSIFIYSAWKIINLSLKKNSPKYIIINSTKDPFNRLLALVAKDLNIKTICIQHGLFSPNIQDEVNEDDIVDIYFSINQNQKKIVSKKIDSSKITLLSKSILNTNKINIKVERICLVGEDWERYGEDSKKQLIIEFYIKLFNFLYLKKNNHLKFYYRPHPSEKNYFGIDKIMPIQVVDPNCYDMFIGFSSTFLWDMASKNKPCLQIHSDFITDIDFELEHTCESIKFDNLVYDRVLQFINEPNIKYIINKIDPFEIIDQN